ncbi:AbrB/MazE/SpoVT family DNA-binding domain-containing protein [Patescibacteria group bacterium]|nr:AbrB/MazE/SpoVT family DNA-binding domain-containing protein [Patescibacteria group bacterium]
MTYTLKLFNTGQVTLPKEWRNKFNTKHFVAEETEAGLLIKPLIKDDTVYYEDRDGFGLYSESGLDTNKITAAIKKLNG